MLGFVKRKIRWMLDWKRIVWNAKGDEKLSFITRLVYALRGFSGDEYSWYDFKHNDYKEYISEFERLNSRDMINGQYKFILDDKLVFEEIYGNYANVPKNYAWVNDGYVYGLHDNGMNNDNLLEYLAKFGKTVLKWNDRGGGSGTYVIDFQDDEFIVNEKKTDNENVKELFNRKGSAILCQYISQSDFSSGLYPHTTNTIRIVCAKKRGERYAKFITAIQRVGCKDSIPVDNASRGALIIPIDEKTGELGVGMIKCGRKDRIRVPFNVHPDTGVTFTGKKIPNWDLVVKQVVELTNKIPYLNFVAWDILLTEDGFTVIEGNASSGCGIFQMNHGVRNSNLGDIFRSYGVFK